MTLVTKIAVVHIAGNHYTTTQTRKMDYTNDQFIFLLEEVDRQGGARLPERCVGSVASYKLKDKITKTLTCFCGEESMLVIPYVPAASEKEIVKLKARGAGFATVCANCDSVGAWPRFEAALGED